MSVLKSIHRKNHIEYLTDQLNFAVKNKLEISHVHLWFEDDESSFPNEIEISFRSKFGEED